MAQSKQNITDLLLSIEGRLTAPSLNRRLG